MTTVEWVVVAVVPFICGLLGTLLLGWLGRRQQAANYMAECLLGEHKPQSAPQWR
jgi:hypothetical protein